MKIFSRSSLTLLVIGMITFPLHAEKDKYQTFSPILLFAIDVLKRLIYEDWKQRELPPELLTEFETAATL